MRKPLPSLSTRTEEITSRQPPLEPSDKGPRPDLPSSPRPADRIRDALLRWLEEEL